MVFKKFLNMQNSCSIIIVTHLSPVIQLKYPLLFFHLKCQFKISTKSKATFGQLKNERQTFQMTILEFTVTESDFKPDLLSLLFPGKERAASS